MHIGNVLRKVVRKGLALSSAYCEAHRAPFPSIEAQQRSFSFDDQLHWLLSDSLWVDVSMLPRIPQQARISDVGSRYLQNSHE